MQMELVSIIQQIKYSVINTELSYVNRVLGLITVERFLRLRLSR